MYVSLVHVYNQPNEVKVNGGGGGGGGVTISGASSYLCIDLPHTMRQNPLTSLPLAPQYQRTNNTEDRQVFPWGGDRLHRGRTSLPLGPFSGDRLHRGRTSLPLRPFSGCTRGPTTQRQTSLPPGPFSGCTKGRLHKDKDK